MKSVLVTTPSAPISPRISSHRGAQGVIYADQIHSAGYKVTVNIGGEISDYTPWDIVAVYHGNDWGGTVNMFGGVKAYASIDQLVSLSKFKGEVWSLAIAFPDYAGMIKPRVDKEPEAHPLWKDVDWTNLASMPNAAKLVEPNSLVVGSSLAFGDSHAISMYRTGWQVNSVPFKTLYGALDLGLSSFVKPNKKYTELESYFGNIDIRHHLMRQPDPKKATRELVRRYVAQAKELRESTKADVIRIWEPLPIENESRKLPKTGYYKGTPFYGSWAERTEIRNVFVEELLANRSPGLEIFQWTDKLRNAKGELDFEAMEKPQSVHLSRASYPHWQGKNWNF